MGQKNVQQRRNRLAVVVFHFSADNRFAKSAMPTARAAASAKQPVDRDRTAAAMGRLAVGAMSMGVSRSRGAVV